MYTFYVTVEKSLEPVGWITQHPEECKWYLDWYTVTNTRLVVIKIKSQELATLFKLTWDNKLFDMERAII